MVSGWSFYIRELLVVPRGCGGWCYWRDYWEHARGAGLQAAAHADLDEARAEFEEEKARAQTELGDARAELDAAKAELDDGQRQLDSAASALAASEKKISDGEKRYAQGTEALAKRRADAEAQFAEAQAAVEANEANLAEANAALPTLEASVAQVEAALAAPELPDEQRAQPRTNRAWTTTMLRPPRPTRSSMRPSGSWPTPSKRSMTSSRQIGSSWIDPRISGWSASRTMPLASMPSPPFSRSSSSLWPPWWPLPP